MLNLNIQVVEWLTRPYPGCSIIISSYFYGNLNFVIVADWKIPCPLLEELPKEAYK